MPILPFLSTYLVGAMPYALLLCGGYFAIRLRAFPFLHPGRVVRGLFHGRPGAGRATCMALAGTVGVGNIAGVALSLLAGGPGAVFWMLVCAGAAMLLKYAEITLSQAHKPHGAAHGGTAATMAAIGWRRMARFFALLCLGYTLLVGGAIQANAVAVCMGDVFATPPLACGLLLILLSLPVIAGGGRRIAVLTAGVVPVMCLSYILITLALLVTHRSALPAALSAIWQGAFQPGAVGGGALGFFSARALRVGAARGLMSNEGGCGTAPMAHATSEEPVAARQGLFGILEVFVDTVVICTLTALSLLVSLPQIPSGQGGIALVRLAFSTLLGPAGGPVLCLLLFSFAYATVLCQAFYGQVCLAALTTARTARALFLFAFSLSLLLGAVGAPTILWDGCDILLSLMTFCNLLLLLRQRQEICDLSRRAGLLGRVGRH